MDSLNVLCTFLLGLFNVITAVLFVSLHILLQLRENQ